MDRGIADRGEDRDALARLGNICYDTAASPLIYGSAVWPDALRACGTGRVLFGSDYPWNLYPQTEVAPALARFVAEARAGGADPGVMGRNAASLLRL